MLRNLSLSLASLSLCLFLLEVSLRVYYSESFPRNYYQIDQRSGLIWAASDYSGYRITEYGEVEIKTNKMGARGAVFNEKDTAKKVLILGDSFVQAIQVNNEETFGHLLANSPNSNFQTMQVAIPGWGQGDQLHWLKTYFEDYKPDIVILAIFLGNDLSIDNMGNNHLGSDYYIPVRNGLILRSQQKELVARLAGRSELVGFVQRKISGIKQKTVQNDKDYISVATYHERFLPIYHKDSTERHQYYDVFKELIDQMRDFQKEKGFQFLPILIPWDKAMDQSKFRYILDHYEFEEEDYSVTLPHEIIEDYFQNMGVSFIDLRKVFDNKPEPLAAYGKIDTHFSPTGHQWTFEVLEEQLLKEGW